MEKYILLVDFGSTYTKITAVDILKQIIVGRASSVSTVGTNVLNGFNKALETISKQLNVNENFLLKQKILACSSAAGGLRMVTIGLIPDLTAEAGKRAALGAGAKVIKSYAYELSSQELREIIEINPDIILLTGGTDGGNKDVIIKNAKQLSSICITCPIIVAGNKTAYDDIKEVFKITNLSVYFVKNVMPEIGVLEVVECQNVIREIFMERIIHAKGLKQVQTFVEQVIMPTPRAVLEAAKLVSQGINRKNGLGDLVVIDIGGATTDVHSIGKGLPTQGETVLKGLPEPFAKRTVEGDLGIRYNAKTIVDVVGEDKIISLLKNNEVKELKNILQKFSTNPGYISSNDIEIKIETLLADFAAEIACKRHAGNIKVFNGPLGEYFLQYGKDLRNYETLIGTGGIFIYGKSTKKILKSALFNTSESYSLRPVSPQLLVDLNYILYAVGLLSQIEPEMALKIAKENLKEVFK